jgi:hypothetical protein
MNAGPGAPPGAKARLLPIYFDPGRDAAFDAQLSVLRRLLADEPVEFLPAAPLGSALPEADAAVFPQLLGEAYRQAPAFRTIGVPKLVVTSEFGTLSMWDWEIIAYLRSEGVGGIVAPYDPAQTKAACRALGVRRQLAAEGAKFVVYQDNPGEGAQASIFKRFYWWEDECAQRMLNRFGVRVEKRSFRQLGAGARDIPDADADAAWEACPLPVEGLTDRGRRSAMKVFLAVKRDLAGERGVLGVGINCLNESHFSDSTPCLAWSLFYEESGMIWGCEADTVSMLSKLVLHRSLGAPVLMTNLYPFLLGQAALKHERIESFPAVAGDPADHILVAHCGYMGVIPPSFATSWTLRPKVLAIVDDNAVALDARIPEGPVTLAKLHPSMAKITAAEGELTGYAGYPGSDCLNGGVVRVRDGRRLIGELSSHHYLLMTGHHLERLAPVAEVFGLEVVAV